MNALVYRFDKTHIARTSYYRDFVFRRHWDRTRNTSYRTVNFIEDSFGQVVSNNIKDGGLAVHRLYGCYTLHDHVLPIVYHADGRRYHAGGHPATRAAAAAATATATASSATPTASDTESSSPIVNQ